MNQKIKLCSLALALLIAVVPLAACSKNSRQTASAVQTGEKVSDNSAAKIVGKVTSVIGNQVTLAVGTLNRNSEASGGMGTSSGTDQSNRWGSLRSQSSGTASESTDSSETASSGSTSSSSGTGSSSSDLITLTGETKTVLIPVGLTLSQGGTRSGSAGANGSAGGSSGGSGGGQMPAGGGQMPSGGGQMPGGSGQTTGGSTKSGKSNSTSTSTGTGTTTSTKKSSDFSSIKKGMILQISERTLSDGTQNVIQVRVLSE